ncbi:MAG TPA: hypothetical protein PK926_09435 [Spirochaetota bacterium]|nr:hypothetical protein [Spirochaetota bacterium]HPI89803.1 hypothetical protein [Spirochaetota bacterium]HPR47556.1 hypothetical protein [Spirochaetota bacterium]
MKDRTVLINNTLIIKSSRTYIWIATFSGIALLISGIYMIFSGIFGGHFTFSVGFMMSSLGLLFFVNSRYYKIYINRDPGFISILESTFTSIAPLKIPIKRYSIISIQTIVTPGQRRSLATSYEIIFMNEFGSSLHVAEFSEKDEAMIFARKLQDLTGRDLYLDNTPVIKNVKLKDIPVTKLAVDLPRKTRISRKYENDTLVLKWKKSFSFFQYFFFISFIYGVFHFFNFVLFADEILSLIRNVVYGILIIALGIVALTFLITNTGTFVLNIKKNVINYYWQFMGKWIRYREVSRDHVIMVKNTFNMNDNHIEIIDKDSFGFINKITPQLKNRTSAPDIMMYQQLAHARHRIIRLDVSSLSINEKFFIEEMLLKE